MLFVLYVDDEPDLLEIGRLFLEKTGDFTVDTLESAQDVSGKIRERHYDAIISDYQMPEMDGITLLKTIRREFGDLPFILFTGRGREEVVIEALENGVDFYLQKGGDPEAQFAELAHKIRQAVLRKTAEHTARESEKRFFDIINFLPDPTFAIDQDRHVIAWNRAIENLTGVSAAEMIGSDTYQIPFYGCRHPMLIDSIFAQNDQTSPGNSTIRTDWDSLIEELETLLPSGKQILALSKAGPLYDQNGRITGAIESIRDITSRRDAETQLRSAYENLTRVEEELREQYDNLAEQEKNLKETEENYRILMENSLDSIYLVRGDRYLLVNSMTLAVTGYTKTELMERSLWDCVHPDDRDRLRKLAATQTPEKNLTYTARIITKSGEVRLFEFLTGRILYKGEPAVLGIARDITRRENVAQQLAQKTETLTIINQIIRASNQKKTRQELLEGTLTSILSLLDYSSGGIYLIDADSRARIICSMDMTRECLREVDNLDIRTPPYDTIFIRGEPIIADHYETLQPDRAEKYGFRSLASIPIVSENRILGAINVASRKYTEIIPENRDILIAIGKELGSTLERMQNREAFEQSEKNFQTLVKNAPDAILVATDHRFVYVNAAAVRFFGATSEEQLLSTPTFDRFHPSFHGKVRGHLRNLEQTRAMIPVETVFLKMDGTPVDAEISAMPVVYAGRSGNLGIIRDISNRKKATAHLQDAYDCLAAADKELRARYEKVSGSEQELRERESLFRSQFDLGFNGIAITTPENEWLSVNRQLCAMFGYSREEIQRITLAEIMNPDDQDMLLPLSTRLLAGEIDHYEKNVRVLKKDRSWILCRMISSCHRNPDRTVRFIISSFEDITEKQRAEEALRESEEKYRQLFEIGGDALFVTENVTGKIIGVNEAAVKMYGYSRAELLTLCNCDLSAEPEKTLEIMAIDSEDLMKVPVRYHRKKDGTVFPVEISISFFTWNGRGVNIGSIRDIADRLQSDDALRHANKKLNLLSSVTRHDIRNQLTILRGCATLAQRAGPDPVIDEYLKKIDTAGATISRQIEFTRNYQDIGIHAPGWYSLCDIQTRVKPKDIAVSCSCGELMIFADPMLEKVFFNLFDNAIRHGDHVTKIDIGCQVHDRNCVIIVEDNGIGVPQKEKIRIFEKGFGKNTGFGLFLVREILALTKITITENGRYGSGARFEIRVPQGSYKISEPGISGTTR